MTDRPILFSTPMVRALIAGRKTMTRRLPSRAWSLVQPGDRLWVREKWAHDAPDLATCKAAAHDLMSGNIGFGPYYFVGEVAPDTLKWRSPIHMPRWASRLTLVITEKKIERLQDISEVDAKAEGVDLARAGQDANGDPIKTYRTGFVYLWSKLHDEESWLTNPEIFALRFTVHQSNIDDMPRQRAA